MRRTLAVYGRHGKSVRVYLSNETGVWLARVQWRDGGQRKMASYPDTADGRAGAKAFGQTVAERLESRRRVHAFLTIAELWARYTASDAYTTLRLRTQQINAEGWTSWALYVGRQVVAEDLGAESVAGWRSRLMREQYALSTQQRWVRAVKTIYHWADECDLIGRNKVVKYRFRIAKDQRAPKVPEYTASEYAKLRAQLPITGPRASRTWRPGGILRLCGAQGARQKAVRHLQWPDVDVGAQTVVWRPGWDKQGRERVQPLRAEAIETLAAIRAQHVRMGYTGPWLFPKPLARGTSPVYTAQALWWALTAAEDRAGVVHKRGRGAHGLRRMLAGDVLALTGNLKLAGDAIGDVDLRVLQASYLHERPTAVRDVFRALDAQEKATEKAMTDTAPDALAEESDGNALAGMAVGETGTEWGRGASNPRPNASNESDLGTVTRDIVGAQPTPSDETTRSVPKTTPEKATAAQPTDEPKACP